MGLWTKLAFWKKPTKKRGRPISKFSEKAVLLQYFGTRSTIINAPVASLYGINRLSSAVTALRKDGHAIQTVRKYKPTRYIYKG